MSDLRERFANAREFATSPLYTELCRTVSEDERLLALAAHARAGQQPTFLFMGAVKYLLGDATAHLTPERFTSFCLEHEEELRRLLETRLVQTNAVPRSLALRLGMVEVARHVDAPVHLVEVGASAGVHLRFDRYGYRLGGEYGDAGSPVQIEAELRGASVDLDAIPPVASATGVDLAPVDATDPEQRRWLEALVWPESVREAALLEAALAVVAADPPPLVAGDAVDVLSVLDVPHPRVVFTVATRMHVPAERRELFDAAIRGFADFWISLERPAGDGAGLYVELPSGDEVLVAVTAPRVDWVAPT